VQYAGGGGAAGIIQDTVSYGLSGQALGPAGGGAGNFTGNNGAGAYFPQNGLANTGGGGGGGNGYSTEGQKGAGGGSGIVVLRYPSYMVPAASCVGGEMSVGAGWRVYTFVASGTITF
jgi:hypothetical protein